MFDVGVSIFVYYRYGDHRDLHLLTHSVPPRRAADLMSTAHMAKTFLAAGREGDGAIQTMMAANAPVLIQRAMGEGRPDEGVLPSGQVAAVIGALPPVAELIVSIVSEAEARLAAVQANCRAQGALLQGEL